jgi:hypothetical protein
MQSIWSAGLYHATSAEQAVDCHFKHADSTTTRAIASWKITDAFWSDAADPDCRRGAHLVHLLESNSHAQRMTSKTRRTDSGRLASALRSAERGLTIAVERLHMSDTDL